MTKWTLKPYAKIWHKASSPGKTSLTRLEKAAPCLAAAFSTAAAFVPLAFLVGGVAGSVHQELITGVSTAGGAFGGGAFAEIARDPVIKPTLVVFIFVLVLLLVWVIWD